MLMMFTHGHLGIFLFPSWVGGSIVNGGGCLCLFYTKRWLNAGHSDSSASKNHFVLSQFEERSVVVNSQSITILKEDKVKKDTKRLVDPPRQDVDKAFFRLK